MSARTRVTFLAAALSVSLAGAEAFAVALALPVSVGDWIREDQPDVDSANFNVFVGSLDGGNALRGVLAVDLSSFTAGDVINSASLSVFHRDSETSNHKAGPATTTDVSLHVATQVPTNLATWNSFDGTNPWTNPGGDFGPAIVTTIADVENINTNEEVVFSNASLTAAIQAAVSAGDAAIGLVLTTPQLEADGVRDFFAFAGDAPLAGEIAPVLNLDFTPQFDIADVNRDGVVNAADFLQISDDLFKTDAELTGVNANSDIDGNGVVDFADFRIWKNTPQGAAVSVPEPTALAMIVLGAAQVLVRGRKRV